MFRRTSARDAHKRVANDNAARWQEPPKKRVAEAAEDRQTMRSSF